MKKVLKYIFIIIGLSFYISCDDDEISKNSIFDEEDILMTNFDNWLLDNYVYQYNISLLYRVEDIETPMAYDVLPAELENSMKMAVLIKHMWLEAYDEIAGIDFTRENAPKIIFLLGSGSPYRGTAESGMKVILFDINTITFTSEYLNTTYFKTMHHEFTHILNQRKKYDPSFELISEGEYIGNDYRTITNQSDALSKGFISPYAMSQPGEDFAEMVAIYVTSTYDRWDALMNTAGEYGENIILEKLTFVKNYMKNSWDINLDELKDILQRRSGEFDLLDLDNLNLN